MADNKVFVLGLDGATFDLITPWVKEGKLPNMKMFMEEGSAGVLNATIPAHSAPSWSSFITGKNPGKHGIFDFSEHRKNSYEVRFVNARLRKGMSIWSILSHYHKKVGIINVPMTYPPEEVNGFMISGMDSPGLKSNFMYPADLYDEIKSIVGEYIIEAGLWAYIKKGKIELAIQKQKEAIEKKFTIMKYLMGKYPWQFFMCAFTATDRAQHVFWKYMDSKHPLYRKDDAKKYGDDILTIYQKMDEIIGHILNKLDDHTTFIVMSDHGAGMCSNKTIYLNNWLNQNGLLKYKDKDDKKSLRFYSRFMNMLHAQFLVQIPRNLWKGLSRKQKDIVKRYIPWLRNRMASVFFFSRLDMTQTKAYAEESKNFIWINVEGREPKGRVKKGKEYEELRDQIIRKLEGLTCPDTKEKVIDRVFKKEEIFYGSCMDKAPDLVVTFRDRGYVPRPSYSTNKETVLRLIPKDELEALESNIQANARHQSNGIVMIKGRDIKQGKKIEEAHIKDLAPTILYLMGVPIPDDMDGKVLKDVIKEEFINKNRIIYCQGETPSPKLEAREVYSEAEEEKISERLKDLGYLD